MGKGKSGGGDEQERYLEKLGHGPSLLFGDGGILLLDHTEAGYGELELDFYFGLL